MNSARAFALAALFVLCAGAALGADGLDRLASGAWPAPDGAAGLNGRPVTFPSASPFGLSDMEVPAPADERTEAQATLFLPDGVDERAPVPAVVMLHGAAGVLYQREITYARQYAAMGIAALVVDAFAARRDRAAGFVARLLEVTETMLIADAYAGLRYLDRLPAVDGRRVALVGFSYGGMASVLAAYREVAERAAPDGLRFAAHVSYYGPCIARFADPRATGAPVLMLWGAKDALIDPARCKEIARDLESGGAVVKSVVYGGAYHQWDGAWHGPFEIGRNLSDCRFRVSRSGVARDRRTWLPMTGPFLRRIILGLCVRDDGYLIGRDDAVRRKSDRDVGRFLAEAFRRAAGRAERARPVGTGGGG